MYAADGPGAPLAEPVRRRRSGSQQRLEIASRSEVGAARRSAQRAAQAAGFDETSAGRVAIVVTELANNLLLHAGGGELLLQVLDPDAHAQLEVLAIDRGPGMSDVQRCLQDGYSTSGTAGTGLGAVRRLSGSFEVYSQPGRGTVVLARVGRQLGPGPGAASGDGLGHFGVVCVPMRGEDACGDGWSLAEQTDTLSLLLVDGLGHGPAAQTAALAAIDAFDDHPFDGPDQIMRRLHGVLGGLRGAAAACAQLQLRAAGLAYCGVGNIQGALLTDGRAKGLVSHNGTLGVQLLRVQRFDQAWLRGQRLVMHSDGISARWLLEGPGELARCHPAVIAAVLYRDFRRERDDATIAVLDWPAGAVSAP